MKLGNGNEISFFKVLRSESEKYIQVPTPFAKKCLEKGNNNMIQTIVLKTKSHVEWNVEFVKIDDGYYFTEGWFKFKKDNHLQTFDFLLFFLRSHSPKLTFEVFFYATNGCQKSLLSSRSGDFPQAETEIGCDDSSKTVGRKLLERAITKSCIHQVPLTRKFVKAVGIEGLCDLKLENDEGKIWEADLKIWGQRKIPFIVKGWADFMKDNKLKIGNRCHFSHVKGDILHVHVIKRKKALAKRLHTPSTSRNAGSSDGKKLSIEELEASDDDSSKNVESSLILRKVVKKSYTRQMQLSKRFVKEAGMDGYLYLQLENDDGKTWEVELKKRGPRQTPHIGEGWSKFVKDNKVKVGNSCDIYHLKENVLHVRSCVQEKRRAFS